MRYVIYGLSLLLTFGITVLVSRWLIPVLKSKKMGQKILEIGPRWHKNKEGTPTMGGLAFVCASFLVAVCGTVSLSLQSSFDAMVPFVLTFAYALLNAGIGIVDDLAKLRKKQNEGLTAPQKYGLQFLAAVLFLAAMRLTGNLETTLHLPFTSIEIELSFGYYVIAILLLTGVVNSVNLNDGIDGLCSSLTFLNGLFLSLAGFLTRRGSDSVSLTGALLCGSSLGFLVYNFYPARVFMGDTGSLFFGGLVVGGCFLLRSPLVVLLCGIVYIAESLSVILQVGYFKLTHGKRLFKMSPIHHHFEQCGWSENKIVAVFSGVTLLGCAAAFLSLL